MRAGGSRRGGDHICIYAYIYLVANILYINIYIYIYLYEYIFIYIIFMYIYIIYTCLIRKCIHVQQVGEFVQLE